MHTFIKTMFALKSKHLVLILNTGYKEELLVDQENFKDKPNSRLGHINWLSLTEVEKKGNKPLHLGQ